MNIIQRIVKNTVALFAAQFAISILSLVLSIFIARNLGDAIFGKYSFALAFTAMFVIFSDLGYNTLLIREVARDKSQASKYLNNVISIRLISSTLIFGLIVATINIMGYPDDVKKIVYIFGIYMLIESFSAVFKTTFRAFEKMEYEAGITIFTNILRVSLGLLVIYLGYGLVEIALAFLFAGIFGLIFSFVVCELKFVKPKIELDLMFFKKTAMIALPLTMLSVFDIIYSRTDIIMLSIMKGDEVVGWYNAAYGLVFGFKPIPLLFMNALFPLMSGYYISSKDSLKKTYELSFKYLFTLGLPLTIGIMLLSERIVLLLYGNQFLPSIVTLQILSWDILLIFSIGPLGGLLVSTDKQNKMAILLGITAFINIILNLILIPSFSYVGAAVASIISQLFLFGLYVYFLSKYHYKLSFSKIVISPIVASSVMGLFICTFISVNLTLLVILAAILYFIILYLTKCFPEEDLNIFKQLINMPKNRR